MVYYKNIIQDPAQLIVDIENLDKKYHESQDRGKTLVKPWTPWVNDSAGT